MATAAAAVASKAERHAMTGSFNGKKGRVRRGWTKQSMLVVLSGHTGMMMAFLSCAWSISFVAVIHQVCAFQPIRCSIATFTSSRHQQRTAPGILFEDKKKSSSSSSSFASSFWTEFLKPPPPPEDVLVLGGDLLSLFVYGISNHLLCQDLAALAVKNAAATYTPLQLERAVIDNTAMSTASDHVVTLATLSRLVGTRRLVWAHASFNRGTLRLDRGSVLAALFLHGLGHVYIGSGMARGGLVS